MRKYRQDSGSEERLNYGEELLVGLSQFAETAPLKAPLEELNARLETAHLARKRAEREQFKSRVQVRFADWALDRALRLTWRSSQVVDGGVSGVITRALFPDGLKPMVVLAGEAQHAKAQWFVMRAKASKVPNVDRVLGEWLPKVEQGAAALGAALEERARCIAARDTAFAIEKAARDEHEVVIEKLMGQVRALFPRDRKRWDVIFPQVSRPSKKTKAEAVAEEAA